MNSHTEKFTIMSIVFISILLAVMLLSNTHFYVQKDIVQYDDDWSILIDGKSAPITISDGSPVFDFVLSKSIKSDDVGKTIMIISDYSKMSAVVDDTVIGKWGSEIKPFAIPGRELIFIEIDESYENKQLNLEIKKYINTFIETFRIGDKADLILYIVLNSFVMLLISIGFLVMGLISIIILPLFTRRKSDTLDIVLIGSLSVLSAINALSRTHIIYLFLDPHTLALTYMIVSYLITLIILIFIFKLITRKGARVISIILIFIHAIGYPLVSLNQIFNPNANLYHLAIMEYLSILYYIFGFVALYLENSKIRLVRVLRGGIIVLLICCILDILRMPMMIGTNLTMDNLFSKAALMLLILFLIMEKTREYVYFASNMNSTIKISEIRTQLLMVNLESSYEKLGDIRRIKHDINGHLKALKYFISTGNAKKAGEYIDNLIEENGTSEISRISENLLIDAMVNDAANQASRKNIEFSFDVNVSQNVCIPENDICCILNNIIDNAMEAAYRTEKGYVSLNINTKNGYLYISCENNYSNKIIKDNESFLSSKDDAKNHGYGLEIVKKLVAKHNGIFNIRYTENVFTIEIAVKEWENKNQWRLR